MKEFVAATSCLGNLPSAGINTTSIGLQVLYREKSSAAATERAERAKAGDVEAMELAHEDAPVVCANEAEQQEESMATSVETQTEAFDYLYRKTVGCEAPDKDAETQTEAFDYLYRETGCLEVPDKDTETQTEEFD